MASVLTIIRDNEIIATAPGPEQLQEALRDASPGEYLVEATSPAGELLKSGYSRQRWGTAARMPDGSIRLFPQNPPVRR